MKKVFIAFVFTFYFIACASWAKDSEKTNNCSNLNIVITNASSENCRLTYQNLRHGFYKFTSSVPMYIPANASTHPIFLSQSIFGPELEVTYACGENRMVTLLSKQNLCFLMAGDVYGQVPFAQNMTAEYQAQNGSAFWSQHGNIHWFIK